MTLRIITCVVIIVCFAVTGSMLGVALAKLFELSKSWSYSFVWSSVMVAFMMLGMVVANYLLFR